LLEGARGARLRPKAGDATELRRNTTALPRLSAGLRLSRSGDFRDKAFGTQAAARRIELLARQSRHLAAPAVERLSMHRAIERIAAARAARAAL
jgi:hypothetical protein